MPTPADFSTVDLLNELTNRGMGVFKEVAQERAVQDDRWGQEHDDQHQPREWEDIIRHYLRFQNPSSHHFRTRMIKIAAVAVAAVESHDRRR